ncbi:MAG: GtrA family protein [Candidatus Magasanikbacteria bacterium]|nr:GtrA family protein [Candidatus Magasanikbacteria bacterium]
MFKKLITNAWSLRHQFFRYFCVGFSAFILDMGSLMLLKEVFDWKPITAVIANQVFIIAYVFLLNKYWSFDSKELDHRQLVRFLILVGFNYAVSITTMYIFNHRLAFDYRLVRIGTIILATCWNFLSYKYWVYRSKSPILNNPLN